MPRRSDKPDSAASADPSLGAPDTGVSFEQAMLELEGIVESMDDDSLALDTLLEHYSRGRQLLKFCQSQIQNAQQRVELINAQADGSATLEPFAKAPPLSTPATAVSAEADDISFS